MWYMICVDIRMSHISDTLFASLWFLVLWIDVYFVCSTLGFVGNCKMPHVVSLVLFMCLFTSKSSLMILINRSNIASLVRSLFFTIKLFSFSLPFVGLCRNYSFSVHRHMTQLLVLVTIIIYKIKLQIKRLLCEIES